ncbi:uracil-DNA glycosylase [Spheniscid alphaherpesvirus 1]|uniref:Uracil-DNA glycosylase n=1 Tax=Spheniscid alphaherpesvirus 1 TaxID=2560777 RepID=A0A1R3TCX5_9ALPH|nr:uracil-DNA glycosylase [Spheniscid alphaherpesvirus 1]SCO83608.1 uracil-DNA glycosylase [Spheniscid alphaherpesvirus 1]
MYSNNTAVRDEAGANIDTVGAIKEMELSGPPAKRPRGRPIGFIPDDQRSQSVQLQPASTTDWKSFSNEFEIGQEWRPILEPEISKPYFSEILNEYRRRCKCEEVLPPKSDVFSWTRYCGPSCVKVVIIGQDPYHQPGQAHGIAFSVKRGVAIPPSLRNIFEAVTENYPNITAPSHGSLESWAREGVLLLNTALTVKRGCPNSHSDLGWTEFVKCVIRRVSESLDGLVFMLWGANAQKVFCPSDPGKHLVLRYSHPSPLSRRPFRDCRHFRDANTYLSSKGKGEVNWKID